VRIYRATSAGGKLGICPRIELLPKITAFSKPSLLSQSKALAPTSAQSMIPSTGKAPRAARRSLGNP